MTTTCGGGVSLGTRCLVYATGTPSNRCDVPAILKGFFVFHQLSQRIRLDDISRQLNVQFTRLA